MSTILKTLKKLEEEKSVLDQNLDLKGLVLQEDAVYPKVLENERRVFFLIAALVACVLVAGGTAFYFWPPTHKEPTSTVRIASKVPAQQKSLAKRLPKPRTFEGVSMAGISGDEKKTATKPEQAFSFFKQLVNKQPSAPEQLSRPLPIEKPPSTKEESSSATHDEIREISNLIRSATTLAKNSPPEPVIIRNGYVPGIKVKGIIFFDEGSAFNHIIVATPESSKTKLRMGDSIQAAVLKSIYPSRVVFAYQGQLIEMGIGQ